MQGGRGQGLRVRARLEGETKGEGLRVKLKVKGEGKDAG